MTVRNKKEPLLIFLGDVAMFLVALWIMLAIRYLELPVWTRFAEHLVPFSALFGAWVAVFYISGLYGKHTLLLKSKLPATILQAQTFNILIAVMFFYFIPYFGITPKVNLFLYLAISLFLILQWRLYGNALFQIHKKEKALLIGSGSETKELYEEVNHNPRYNLFFVSYIDFDKIDAFDLQADIIEPVYSEEISTIVIDLRSDKIEPILPRLYNLIFSNVRFIDMHRVYEDIFDRIPLSLLNYSWFLENVSLAPKRIYDTVKRLMDIAIALSGGLVSLPFYPLVYAMIKLDDGGSIFIAQQRIGKNNKAVKIFKFRTMSSETQISHAQDSAARVTRVGTILRNMRIDELPQLWNVLKGDLSFIGPRPELPELVKLYEKEIQYYHVRHLIKPGLSGWAQIHQENPPKFGADFTDTKTKLSYDLYYIKNRSLAVDLAIALKTFKILASRSGL